MSERHDTTGPKLYNSRILDAYIKLIKRHYSYINISELLECAGIAPYEVADQGHWFTQEQVNQFHDHLRKLTGNQNIAREAGRYAGSPDASGVMRLYFLGLVGPSKAFEMIGKGSINFTRSSRYESRRIAPNKVEVVVTPNEGVKERAFQCENRMGFMEAILMLFNCSVQKIQHDECIFRGGNSCRYVISWEKTLSSSLKRLRNYFVIASLVLISLLIPFTTWASLLNTVAAVTGAALLLSIIVQGREKKELGESLDKLRDSTDQLLEQININYNNALLTNEIGQAISRQTDVDAILGSVVQVLENRLDYERGLILLANPENTSLVFRAGFGYTEELLRLLNKTTFHLDRPESKGIFIVSFREQKPFLVNNMDEVEGNLSLRSLAVAKKLGAQSFICCPIICDGQSVGILAVDNVTSRRPLVQSDMSLLMGIAPVIGISIHNASLIDAKVRQFSSLLQVMAATIDARDPLTAGHSEKVTEYALGICGELGMSKEYSDMIRVAALLHDYGKIGVPDSILKKNGKLTDLEYEVVKTHAYKTRDILEQVNFDGVYCQVPEIAGSHHEKIDGSGYPKGLKGKAIPLGAKILAVADFFEAVTAKRHYRDPMPVEEAIRLLREGSGTHFEKKIVDALISYYSKSTTDQHLHLLKSS